MVLAADDAMKRHVVHDRVQSRHTLHIRSFSDENRNILAHSKSLIITQGRHIFFVIIKLDFNNAMKF